MFGALFRRGQTSARVSVVVPLYNHAAYIDAAIGSVLAQGDIVKELIVIDDGSTDESAAVMAKFAARDPRIRFSSQPNQGAHATINAALAPCSADYMAILNSDDAYLPGRLETLAAALDAHPDAGIAASGLAFFDGTGAAIENAWYAEALAFHRNGAPLAAALLNGNFLMTTSNFMFRRSTLAAVGGFAPLRYAHDLDWLLRALALGQQLHIVETPLLRYRLHNSNTISEDHGAVRAEWALVAAAYLTALWDRPGAAPIDWPLAAAIQTVLRRHELDRAVPPAMAYLRRHGGGALDRIAAATLDDVKILLKDLV